MNRKAASLKMVGMAKCMRGRQPRTVTDEVDPFSARDDPGGVANVGDQDPARTASPSRVCSRAPAAARRARRWDDAEVKEVENGLWVDLRPRRQRGQRVRALGVVELAVDDAPAQGLDGEAVRGAGAFPASQSREWLDQAMVCRHHDVSIDDAMTP
jgi:hypothetical protein